MNLSGKLLRGINGITNKQCRYSSSETTSAIPSQKSPRKLTNEIVRQKRTELFTQELNRQKSLIPRIEKITVEFLPQAEEESAKFMMNKDISTPYNVAQHIQEKLLDRSALALVNDELWDMHRPLEQDCTVKFLHFQTEDEDPFHVNRAFWRSCSFMLGDALESLFKSENLVTLYSFPAPNVHSGSFVHDVDLKFSDWSPSKLELMSFSAYLHRLSEKALPFERLVVDASTAIKLFEDNPYKIEQIPSIASASTTGHSVTLYRMGNHVDMSRGPMMADSSFLGRRCSIVAAHPIQHDGIPMYRFQGVALPKGFFLDSFSYGILEKRAAKLNNPAPPKAKSNS